MSDEPETILCECGGKARWVNAGPLIDQMKCQKCGYETASYFDGVEYAIGEIQRHSKAWGSALPAPLIGEEK